MSIVTHLGKSYRTRHQVIFHILYRKVICHAMSSTQVIVLKRKALGNTNLLFGEAFINVQMLVAANMKLKLTILTKTASRW